MPPLRIVRVVRMQGEGLQALKSSVRFVPAEGLEAYRDRPASLITTTIDLKHLDAAKATRMLSRFFSNAALEGFASLEADDGRSTQMMIVGFGPTLCSIQDLLHQCSLCSGRHSGIGERALKIGVASHQVDECGEIRFRGDGVRFSGCDVEQRACVTRCGGPHAHASVCCCCCTSSLYLKGTSVYLYHGDAACCS